MRIRPGYTDLFLSPVTGKLATSSQLPGLSPEYTYLGNQLGETQPSPIIIDIRLDLISLRKLIPIDISDSSFLLKTTDPRLPKSQSLESLKVDGLLKTVTNTLHLAVANTDYLTPDLLENKVWIGDENNKAAQSDTIGLDNLPSLTKGKVWQGDSLNRPEEAELDLAPTDATYIIQKPNASLPNAQALSELIGKDPRILKASALGEIEVAIEDTDYATVETLERIKAETEAFKDEAEAAAEEATAAAEEASGAAAEATASAAEASGSGLAAGGSAFDAGASAFAAGASAFAAGASAFAAGVSASSASGSADNSQQSAEASQNSAMSSQGSATSAATSLATLLATGLNALPNHGDVNFQGFKAIHAGTPTLPDDLTTKEYVDSAISAGNIPVNITGFVEGLEDDKGHIFTTIGPDCLLTNIPAGGNVDMGSFRLKNLQQSPEEDFDGVSATFLWDLMHDEVQILWS